MYYVWGSMGTSGGQWEAVALPFTPIFPSPQVVFLTYPLHLNIETGRA